ncbi:MAG: class I SAM-dependent methyltransferase [Bacteroidetes bacterium]|nr:MAG: class I SAM-dependent methyltransferase [Bacteroidota bacterium]
MGKEINQKGCTVKSVSRSRDWEEVYLNNNVEELPWYRKKLDHDVKIELKRRKIKSGTVLDLGTGPGTQALELNMIGFDVTATDISESAINNAKKLSDNIDFILDDILTTKLRKKFDLILDRGCFHTIETEERKIYLKNIKMILNKNGLLFLKCFSDREPDSGTGPNRISELILKDLFSGEFDIEKIIHTEFKGRRKPNPKALFVVMRKM